MNVPRHVIVPIIATALAPEASRVEEVTLFQEKHENKATETATGLKTSFDTPHTPSLYLVHALSAWASDCRPFDCKHRRLEALLWAPPLVPDHNSWLDAKQAVCPRAFLSEAL